MTAISTCRLLALEPADMLLGIELEPDPPDQVKLGFEEVDVVLLVLHQAFEQIARDVVLDAVAVGRRFLIKATGADLGGEVALDDFLDVLPDPQGIQHLHVGKPVEEQDAIGEPIGVMHLLDGFLAPLLGQLQQTPVVQHPKMQPILVDGGELAAQTLVEIFDDSCVALHDALSLPGPKLALEKQSGTLPSHITRSSNLMPKGPAGEAKDIEDSGDNFERKFAVDMPMRPGPAVRASGMAGLGASTERLVNDGFDAAGASATFGAATEAAIDLLGVAWKVFRGVDGITDIVVAEDVAGTDNHKDGGLTGDAEPMRYL